MTFTHSAFDLAIIAVNLFTGGGNLVFAMHYHREGRTKAAAFNYVVSALSTVAGIYAAFYRA